MGIRDLFSILMVLWFWFWKQFCAFNSGRCEIGFAELKKVTADCDDVDDDYYDDDDGYLPYIISST